jgi:signal transduction protein with GAF and PtsI domain
MKDLQSRLDQALKEAMAHVQGDSGTIHLKEPDRLVLRLAASAAVSEAILEAVREVPWGKGMAGMVAEQGRPVCFIELPRSTSPDIHPTVRQSGLHDAIVVPMMHGDDVVGTIGIGFKIERTMGLDEIRWLTQFGRELATDIGAPTAH